MNERIRWLQRILVFSALGISLLGQLQRVSFAGGAFYFHEVLLVLAALLGICSFQFDLKKVKKNLLFQTGTLFLLWGLLSLCWSGVAVTALLPNILYMVRILIYVSAAFTIAMATKKEHLSTWDWVITWTVGLAILGLFQYVFIPDTRGLLLLGWDEHYFRLISTLFDPGYTGLFLGIGTLLLVLTLWGTKKNWLAHPYRLISIAILFLALLLTYSRASYVAFAVGSLFLVWKKRSFFPLLLIVLMGLSLPLLPRPASEGARLERTASVTARLGSIESAIGSMSPRDYVIGKGWYVYRNSVETTLASGFKLPNHASAPDNSYIFLLQTLGIVGLTLFCVFIYALWKQSEFSLELGIILTTIGIHSLFSNAWFYAYSMLLLAFVMGSIGQSTQPLSHLKQDRQRES